MKLYKDEGAQGQGARESQELPCCLSSCHGSKALSLLSLLCLLDFHGMPGPFWVPVENHLLLQTLLRLPPPQGSPPEDLGIHPPHTHAHILRAPGLLGGPPS